MSNVLKIKSRQSGAAGAPASLARAELAYNEQDDTIYIGHGSGTDSSRTKKAIGGVGAFVDKASSQVLTNKDLTATSNQFTVATATQSGVVELATDAETNTGTDQFRAVTPAGIGAFTGTNNITTVGTISTGVWSGTKLVAGKVPNIEDLTVGGDLAMGGNKITGLADPTIASGAATKSYVDAARSGLDVKASVRVASTAAISGFPDLSSAPTIDGITLQDGDRVLIKDESSASNNGIWVWNNLGSVFSRATDFDTNTEVTAGAFTFVEEGSTHADSGWVVTTNDDITVGTTGITWSQFSGAGQITAGDGVQKSGNTLSVMLVPTGGLDFATHAGKQKITANYSDANALGTLPVAKGGTGATTASAALANLGYTGATNANNFTMNISNDGGSADAFASGSTLNITGGSGIGVNRSSNSFSIAVDTTSVATLTSTQTLTNKTIDCGTF